MYHTPYKVSGGKSVDFLLSQETLDIARENITSLAYALMFVSLRVSSLQWYKSSDKN